MTSLAGHVTRNGPLCPRVGASVYRLSLTAAAVRPSYGDCIIDSVAGGRSSIRSQFGAELHRPLMTCAVRRIIIGHLRHLSVCVYISLIDHPRRPVFVCHARHVDFYLPPREKFVQSSMNSLYRSGDWWSERF